MDLPKTANELVIRALLSKYSFSYEHLLDAMENGRLLQTSAEGSAAESLELEKVLYDNDFYQKAESRLAKQEAFEFLRVIVQEWSLNIARVEKRISREEMQHYMARVLVFGSYVLELNSNDSDVDVICVVPNFINREKHFFEDLAAKFEAHPAVKNLSKITTSNVPIITFDFKGMPIDISFSQLNMEIVPKDIEKNLPSELIDSIIDEKCKLSLLGRRNNVMIKESVPHLENFKSTLRLVKVWAKNRGISSNQMGYLGGISWAILVAKICQIFPNHHPNKLLAEFFHIFEMWDWRTAPVKIVPMETEKGNSIMTVFTPGVAFNSTTRINEITFRVIMKEIKRANELIEKRDIKRIFEKSDFFNEYPVFIEIDICGENTEPHHVKDYNEFLGSVQSKIVTLLSRLCSCNKTDIENSRVFIAPNPRIFKKTDEKFPFAFAHFFGVSVAPEHKIEFAKAVQLWSCDILTVKKKRSNLQVFIYETLKNELVDVEIEDNKRKREEPREDPRLSSKMFKKTAEGDFFKNQYIK